MSHEASDAAGSQLSAQPWRDPVIEVYKKDVDRTVLRENLKLTVDERFRKFEQFVEYARELREAARRARGLVQLWDVLGNKSTAEFAEKRRGIQAIFFSAFLCGLCG